MLPLPAGASRPAADSPGSRRGGGGGAETEGEMNGTAPSPSDALAVVVPSRGGGRRPPPRAGGCRPRWGSRGRHAARRGRARAPPAPLVTRRTPRTSSVLSTMDSAPAEADVLASPASRSADAAAAADSDSADTRRGRDAWRCARRDARGARGRATRVARRLGPALGGAAAAAGFVSVIPSRAVVRAASWRVRLRPYRKTRHGSAGARSHHR